MQKYNLRFKELLRHFVFMINHTIHFNQFQNIMKEKKIKNILYSNK